MKLKTTSLLVAGALFGAAVIPAQASEAMMDLLKVLKDQGTITAENYELLSNAAKADKEATEATANEVKKAAESMPKITTKGKIKVESADGNWSFQPIGRVMWDYIATDEDDSGADDYNGTELRRARLGFSGKVYDWGYKFEGDFSGGDADIKDAYVSRSKKLDGMKAGVKFGQSHIPFGINTKISSKYMTFMDRPWYADSSLSPARQSGVVASLAEKKYKWTVAAGYSIGELDGGETRESVSGETFAVRGSFVPYQASKTQMVQVGAGYMNTANADDGYGFSQRLVSHVDDTKWLDTDGDYDEYDAFTVDALAIFGSFHALAEYLDGTLEGDSGSDGDVTAYSVEAGYFLTGESLKWKKGYTSGIAPKSSAGAWQIGARYETTELDEASGEDEASKFTIGLNYYPTQNTRLMVNYDQVTDLTVNGSDADFEPSALKFRAQAYW